jgi:hypothetical protein
MPDYVRSAMFVDFENVYLSLRATAEPAANRFVTRVQQWVSAVEGGSLVQSTANSGGSDGVVRRILVRNLYADMAQLGEDGRRYFARNGFNVVDCPALTGAGKNSSDIRMIMDIVEFLGHTTRFDEFIIFSADADFTPVILKLREHDRRTVIFDNGVTASAYKAACDGWIGIEELAKLLRPTERPAAKGAAASPPATEQVKKLLVSAVVKALEEVEDKIPLTKLAQIVRKQVGDDKVEATSWAGYITFGRFLETVLPQGYAIDRAPPGFVIKAGSGAPVAASIASIVPPSVTESSSDGS